MTTTELSAHPERAAHGATRPLNQAVNGRVMAPLADLRYRRPSALVERLLEPPLRTHHHGDNPAGAPACVAVRK